jgi:hypothetical protein
MRRVGHCSVQAGNDFEVSDLADVSGLADQTKKDLEA